LRELALRRTGTGSVDIDDEFASRRALSVLLLAVSVPAAAVQM
jgi:hypothetical protein